MEARNGKEQELTRITPEMLKSKTGEFDLESILFLKLRGLGLQDLGCIGECLNLERLDLSDNNFTHLAPLSSLKQMVALNLSSNRISSLEPLASCDNLQTLNVAGNLLCSFESLQCLKGLRRLESIRLRDPVYNLSNPLCANGSYRVAVMDTIPSVRVIDGERVTGTGSDLYHLCKDIDNSLKRVSSSGAIEVSGAIKPWVEEGYWDLKPTQSTIIDETYKQFSDILRECKELSKRADDTIAQAERTLSIRGDTNSYVF
ncbi:leucine-rich repeat-containing protein 61 [Bufo gargarizans]|uniref:leucine-rich repeat-containing protein 61 n=1 Tax=Bufo gargarizans TaxID=30331 RepID=UPI001CF29F2B|nr:leucine-rich repeat-containing protein 61 [Bufo gargarizans]XP_044150911.1 leucine-rich repeat-containing protein 61 [Bufo gargarizans]